MQASTFRDSKNSLLRTHHKLSISEQLLTLQIGLFVPRYNHSNQGPLKKWTEHSQELHLLKIHRGGGGAPITPWGWMGVDFLDHELL